MNGNTPWRTTRGTRLLAFSQSKWYRINNLADAPTQLAIYDEIGFSGVTANDLIADLSGVTGPIDVHLNSPGGEVNEGLAIYNCLMARDDVSIYVDGIAASIASVIAMAGDKIFIAPSAQIMVHNPFSGMIGDADDFRAMADQLDENRNNIARIYAARTGKSEAHWTKVMKNTGWYRGQEAIDVGLADELTELRVKGKGGTAASASAVTFDLSVYGGKLAARASSTPIVVRKDSATRAYEQEAKDYPGTACAWMHHANWKGPVKVQIQDIDPEIQWSEGSDPDHVQDFINRIKDGKKLKPIILVKTPGEDKLQLVDGHHRFLAAAEMKSPIRAYVGTVDSEHGPWEDMHKFQDPDNKKKNGGKKATGLKKDKKKNKDVGATVLNGASDDADWLGLDDAEFETIISNLANLRGVQ